MNEDTKVQQYETVPPPAGNPFAVATIDDRLNAGTVQVESSRAIAEAQGQLLIAKKFPRNLHAAYENILNACSRKDFAEAATYSFPRGGKTVSGPSIRLAEELARSFGNLEFGIKELAVYDDATEVEAYCHDLETNVRSKQTFRSPHERYTKNGTTKLHDPRDIYETNANLGARRLRSRILAIIPPEFVAGALKRCRETLTGEFAGVNTPLTDKVRFMVSRFGKLGIRVTHIEARLGHSMDEILPDEYADLVGVFNSISDGHTSASDWFSVSKSQGASESAQKIDNLLSSTIAAQLPNAPEMIAEIETVFAERNMGDLARVKFVKDATGKAEILTKLSDEEIRKVWEAMKK